jgi:phosphoserine aminotransferase
MLKDLKQQRYPNTMVVAAFITLLSVIDRSSRQKINKEILAINDTIDLTELTDVYRVLHPPTTQYTFFSEDQWNFLQSRSYLRAHSKFQQI